MPRSVPESTAVRDLEGLVDGYRVEAAHRLTPVQESMLFHCLAEPAPDLYAIQQRLEIEGDLDVAAFREAWVSVVARHPALRSCFVWRHDGPARQVVCSDVTVDLLVEDLSDADDVDATLEQRFEADLAKGFQLDRPPLTRLALFRTGPGRHVLCWNQHHLLEDGWSSTVVLSEVFDAYDRLRRGEEPDRSPAPGFGQFLSWLDEHTDPVEEAAFWRSHLAGFTTPTRMASAAPSDGMSSSASVSRDLGAEGTAALRALARTSRVTINTVLVAGLAIALSRHLDSSDVVFGFVTSGRPPTLPDVESIVGVFVNTLPFRLHVDDAMSVADLLRNVQGRQSELLAHQHTGLADIEAWSEMPPNTPLTDTLFAFWGFGGAGETPSGDVRYRTTDGRGRTGFPLDVTVEAGDTIEIVVDHDPSRIDRTAAAGFLDHYVALLAAMAADPRGPVGELAVVEVAAEPWRGAYNDTVSDPPFGSVPEAFAGRVAATPAAVAVSDGGHDLSYEDLDRISSALAAEVSANLPEPGSPVGIHLPRSAALIVAVLAAWKAGAPFVPIDRHLPPARIRTMVEDGGIGLLLTDDELGERAGDTGATVLSVDLGRVSAAATPTPLPDPGEPAYVIYTSGSTGQPKGVVVTHGSLANYAAWAFASHGRGLPTSYPLFNSIGFDGTLASVVVPLVSGGTIVVYPDDDPLDPVVRDVFSDDVVDVVDLTPSHLALLDDRHFRTTRIRRLVLGAEELRVSVARRALERSDGTIEVYNEYGPTEATIACLSWRFDPGTDTAGSVPLGKPIDNTRVYLLDGALRPVPIGVPGEIHVAGMGVAVGYLGRPDLTEERFVPDPFVAGERMYHTGDRARWLAPGILEFLGRIDDQVKVRGVRIELGEVEAALESHPAIAAAAVAVREPRPGDQRLVAYYVPSPSQAVNVTDLRRHLRERLPEYMVVRHLVRLDALPLTRSGKLDRSSLPDRIGEAETPRAHVPASTPAEALVAEAVAKLLDVERPGMSDNFFDLGGHSLSAMRLVASLAADTGVRVSPRLVLLDTLGRVADAIGAAWENPDAAAAVPVVESRTGSLIGSTAVHFGAADRPLFGIHQSPTGDSTLRGAVLVCPPLGWEYMRTHWALRRVSRALAAAGHHVLRFDFSGTGDSAGEVDDDAIERWVEDVGIGTRELADASGVATVSLLGARMGGTLAVLAAAADLPVDRIVLWDPVIRGADHLAGLERMHRELLAGRGLDDPSIDLVGDELLGFPYPQGVRDGLRAIDLASVRWPSVPTILIASADRPDERLVADMAGVDHRVVPDVGTWDELASVHAQLLPTAIPAELVAALTPEAT